MLAADLYAAVRPLINPAVVDFLSARYPTPSQYELPPGRVNDCRWVQPLVFCTTYNERSGLSQIYNRLRVSQTTGCCAGRAVWGVDDPQLQAG